MKRPAISLALLWIALPGAASAQQKTFTVNADFGAGSLTQTSIDPKDQVQLGSNPVRRNSVVWATNYVPGWVVKIDGPTGKQLGRYDAALFHVSNDPKLGETGARPSGENCNWGSQGNCPGRVTVDTNGDVWIINRAFGTQGTLSKFTSDLNRCIDRNRNGVIDTSSDVNGDGVIDPRDPKEFLGQKDECLLVTVKVGGPRATPRGVAVDRNGKIWACAHSTRMLYRFDPAEPVTLEASVQISGNPYSLATGGDYVFASNSGGKTARVHIRDLTVDYAPCGGTYGVVGDPSGDVAWLGNYGGSGVYKADFKNGTCVNYQTGSRVTAVTLDMDGNVWAAGYNRASVHKLSPQGVLLGTFPSGGGAPHGLSVDFQGFIWSINDSNNTLGKIAPDGKLVGAYSIGGPAGYNYRPYIYSDFTGVQIDRQAPYTRFGNWRARWDSGAEGAPWVKVEYNKEPEGDEPPLTKIAVLIRAADNETLLALTPFRMTVNGAPIQNVDGRFVELEVDMTGPGYRTPVLSDISVIGPCPVRGENCCIVAADCNDGIACTDDICPSPGAACIHPRRKNCCNDVKDCDDGNMCTQDVCPGPGRTCQHVSLEGCCNEAGDCNDGNLCTTDSCDKARGMCLNEGIAGCCNEDPDCMDVNACSIDVCSGKGGHCSHFPRGGCCNVDADCDDKNACTKDKCPGAGRACQHDVSAGCCNEDSDCVDADSCTVDRCSGPGGVCLHDAAIGCCNVDDECDDSDVCTNDICSGPGGRCGNPRIQGCCYGDDDCNDADVCTTDRCSGFGGLCENSQIKGCCRNVGDCDDGDPCTADACDPNNSCVHTANGAGCCLSDADCDDKDVCTIDVCIESTTCGHQRIAGCCNDYDDCPGQMCVDNRCQDPGQVGVPTSALAGGGCTCDLGAGSNGRPPPWTGLLIPLAIIGLSASRGGRRRSGDRREGSRRRP